MNKLCCLSPVGIFLIFLFSVNVAAVTTACLTDGVTLPVIAILLSVIQIILYRQQESKRRAERSRSKTANADEVVGIPIDYLHQRSHIWN